MTDEAFGAAFGEIITNPTNGVTPLGEYMNDVSVAASNQDFNSLFCNFQQSSFGKSRFKIRSC